MTLPPGVSGQLPLPTGAPVRVRKPSPSEKAVLEQIGWQEGDPVPTELAAVISELRDAIDEAKQDATNPDRMPPPVPLTTKPLEVPKALDIESLDPDKRAEYTSLLRDMLSQAKAEDQSAQAARSRALEDVDPSINQAILASGGQNVPGVQVVDDLQEEPAPKPEPAPRESELADPNKRCAYCGWPASQDDITKLTEGDKLAFVAAILGGRPFRKTYSFYGGQLKLTFRTLSPQELDAAHGQVYKDIRDGLLASPADEREKLARYISLMMLAQMTLGGRQVPLPTIDPSDIRKTWTTFEKEVLSSTSMMHHVVGAAGRFTRAVEKLEVNAENPDFYPAIDSES